MSKIGFIGAGNMATAIINGIIGSGSAQPEDIFVFDTDQEKLGNMATQKGILPCTSGSDVVTNSHIIVLAVKPQHYADALEQLKSAVTKDKVFVTIAAGISIGYVTSAIGVCCPCVRVMPNTPLLLGCGATALCPSDNISDDDFATVRAMFSNSGVTEVLPESQMNTIIAVNGSSPAYIYLFAKAMADYAAEQGIDKDAAMNLACATLKGSAEMLLKSGDTPEELIKKVCSPGGTTLAAMEVLENGGFYNKIKDGMAACTKRAEELGK